MVQKQTKYEQVSYYLSKHQLTKVFGTLIYQMTMCKARVESVNIKVDTCKDYLKRIINAKYDVEAVIRLQMAQMDLISALFVLMEDYLSYSHFLRNDRIQLSEMILGEKTVTWKEVDFLEALNLDQTYQYMLLASVDRFPMLDNQEKAIVKKNLEIFARDIYDRIKRIVNFFRNHNRVYVKFKHIFPGIVGAYTIQQNIDIPRIFVRDRILNRKTGVTEAAVYILPNSLEAFDYYDNMKNDISRVFLSLLEVHIQDMQNLGGPFLPLKTHLSIEDPQWLKIVQKVNLFTALPNITMKINVEGNRIDDMLKALSEDFIYKYDRDPLSSFDITSVLGNE
jgi:hypothetical protein